MKRLMQNLLLGSAALLIVAPSARAEVKENPFTVIVERNAFRLKPIPPPPPPGPTNAPAPPPSNVRLTGIYEWSGVKKVLLEVTDPVSKKVEHPSPLTEGDEQGQLKILSIDVKEGKVKIQNGTELATIGFETPKTGGGGAGGGPGGSMPSLIPGLPTPMPLGVPPAPATASAPGGGAATSGNVMMGGAAWPGSATTGANYNGAAGMPSRPLRTSVDPGNVMVGGYGTPNPAYTSAAAQSQVPVLNPEEEHRLLQRNYELIQSAEQSGAVQKGASALMPVFQNIRKAGTMNNASQVPGASPVPSMNPTVTLPIP